MAEREECGDCGRTESEGHGPSCGTTTDADRPPGEPRTASSIERAIVPHGPNGECSDPDLCTMLTDYRLAIEAESSTGAALDARAKALQQAILNEPWHDVDGQGPVDDFTDEYALRVAARLAEQEGPA